MSDKVGVEGDVQATPSSTPPETASGGSWSAGSISYKTYSQLKVGGTPVIHEASCTFTYSGGTQKADSSKAHQTVTSTVTLTATTKLTQHGLDDVLVNGDSEQDSYGNQLAVQAAGVLKTD